MVIFSLKIRKPFGLVYFRADKLHYLRITNTTILVYGESLMKAFDELSKVLDNLTTMKNEVNILRKDTPSERLAYFFGLIPGFFLKLIIKMFSRKNINDNINNIKRDLIAFSAT